MKSLKQLHTYFLRKGRPARTGIITLSCFAQEPRFQVKVTVFSNGSRLSTVLLQIPPSVFDKDERPTYETIYFPAEGDHEGTKTIIAPFSPIRCTSKQEAQRQHRSLRHKLAAIHGHYGAKEQPWK